MLSSGKKNFALENTGQAARCYSARKNKKNVFIKIIFSAANKLLHLIKIIMGIVSVETSKAWQVFLANIKDAKNELGNPEILWFRGHSNAEFRLLPSLLRYSRGLEKEQELFYKFKRYADKLFKSKNSEWETLFDMQHYGIPTRLLDWTENFGIALFFAAYYNSKFSSGKSASMYLLNPVKLNLFAGRNSIVRLPTEENNFRYSDIYFQKRPFSANSPIAIEPIFNNDRIMAQRGNFTIHDDSLIAIEEKFPGAIKKIILDGYTIQAALEFLDLANITEYSVFPDFSGIAGYLIQSSGLLDPVTR